jgi:hypothetical protein
MRLAGAADETLNDEADSAQEQNSLRDALSGIREGMLASMMGQKDDCRLKIIQGIKKLRSLLPTKSVAPEKGSSNR